jgi:hypothetical protein
MIVTNNIIIHAHPVKLKPNNWYGIKGRIYEIKGNDVVIKSVR